MNFFYFFVGLLIGGLSILVLKKDQENKLLKTQNKILQAEKEDRVFRIAKNETDIKSLKDKDTELEFQILNCLDWLSKLTKIKDEVESNTNIVTTRRFRESQKLVENKDDNYISK